MPDTAAFHAELEQAKALSADVLNPYSGYNPVAEHHLLELSPRLTAAVQAVLGRHHLVPDSHSALFPGPYCSCGSNYPCADVRAVLAAWGGQD